MDLYFHATSNADGSDATNWWTTVDLSGSNGNTPSMSDACYIVSGVTCSTDNFSRQFLYVDGTLESNNGDVTSVNGSGYLTNNLGVVTTNYGTIAYNYGTVSTNSGNITNQVDAFYFAETTDTSPSNTDNWFVNAGLTINASILPLVTKPAYIQTGICSTDNFSRSALYVNATLTTNNGVVTEVGIGSSITDNNGTITANLGTVSTNFATVTENGGTIELNPGIVTTNTATIVTNSSGGVVTTNSSGGTVTDNNGTITTNNSGATVTRNSGVITTNSSGGIVTNNIFGGVITTNSGTLKIGTVVGGTGSIVAFAATNLSNHTAGANVTLPSGGSLSWW